MASTTLTKAVSALIASGSIAAGGAARGAIDLRTAHGGIVTCKITNGGTGPTVAAAMKVMIAHDTGATPSTGAAGAVWKTVAALGATTTASDVTELCYIVPPGVLHLQVEISGNTGQAVTGEASISYITAATTA